jgi:hypothetical protein
MANDIDQNPAARRDRGLGEDRGQHGALHSQDRTQPNKSAMGATDAPPSRDRSLANGARPEIDQGDEQNLGR